MDGIILLSFKSGMPIYTNIYKQGFGREEQAFGGDSVQISSFLYTLYKNSECISKATNGSEDGVVKGLESFVVV